MMRWLQRFRLKEQSVVFACGDLKLVGALSVPQGGEALAAMVMCHPHPRYGGNMNNHVVFEVCRALHRRGIASLRFNFRGVGGSQGDYDEGIGEQEDVRAALDLLLTQDRIHPDRVGLCGYSFGAAVALWAALKDERFAALALISPALGMGNFSWLAQYPRPKFIISGDEDAFVLASAVEQLARSLPQPAGYEIVRGADHFWDSGYYQPMSKKVADFFGAFL